MGHGMWAFPARQTRAWAAPCLMLLAAAGCATSVDSHPVPQNPQAASALARPNRVLVADFQIDPQAVVQDQGIGPRLERQISGADPHAARDADATEVQSAITDTLLDELGKTGLQVSRAQPGAALLPGDLLVTGRVTRIDEGNRTRRLGIGFGAGESIVSADAALYAGVAGRPPTLLETYEGKADSGRKPGLAVGASTAIAQSSAAPALLSGAMSANGERNHSQVGEEAASLGHRLARDIGKFAAGRGWIAESAVPDWTR